MEIIILPLTPSSITIYFFLVIVFIVLAVLLKGGDTKDKTYQKIIGGVIIFIVALISQESFVIFASLFIGGLIIASEKFLQSLAAILRTNGAEMAQTLVALNKTDITPASTEELTFQKKKEESDVKEEPYAAGNANTSNRLTFDQRIKLDEKIIAVLKDKYKKNFTPDLKFENKYGKIVVDGVIHMSSDSGNLNLGNILALVEIQYISNPKSFMFEFLARRVLERVRYLFITKQSLILFCAKQLTKEIVEDIEPRLKNLFSVSQGEGTVAFGFLRINDDLSVEVIKLPDPKSYVQ